MFCKSDPWLHPFVLSDHSALTSVSRLMWHQDLPFARTHTHTHSLTHQRDGAGSRTNLTDNAFWHSSTLCPYKLFLQTALAIGHVRPSVSTVNYLTLTSPGTESRGQRSIQKYMCCTSVYWDVLWVFIDGRSSRFPCWRQQLRASAARRAEWRGRSRSPARVGVVTQPVWLWSSVEGSGVTSHRQPRQCRGAGAQNGKGGPKWPELCIKTVSP